MAVAVGRTDVDVERSEDCEGCLEASVSSLDDASAAAAQNSGRLGFAFTPKRVVAMCLSALVLAALLMTLTDVRAATSKRAPTVTKAVNRRAMWKAHHQEGVPTVAFLFTGGVRTFDSPAVRRSMMNNVVRRLAGNFTYRSFFLMTVDDEAIHNLPGAESKMSRPLRPDELAPFRPASAGFYDKRRQLLSSFGWDWQGFRSIDLTAEKNCENKAAPRHEFNMQWGKVRDVYQMLTDYEEFEGHRFDYVVRLRGDTIVVDPVSSIQQMMDDMKVGPQEVIIPAPISGLPWENKYSENDFYVVCPRTTGTDCSRYFNYIENWCQYPELEYHDPVEEFMGQYLEKAGLTVRHATWLFTKFHRCPAGAECAYLNNLELSHLLNHAELEQKKAKCELISHHICHEVKYGKT